MFQLKNLTHALGIISITGIVTIIPYQITEKPQNMSFIACKIQQFETNTVQGSQCNLQSIHSPIIL